PRRPPSRQSPLCLFPTRCCPIAQRATGGRGTDIRRRVLAAVLAALGFYALSDILLWQRIFDANRLWMFDDQYQTGHVVMLVALMAVGGLLLVDSGLWALWYLGALYTTAFGG